MLVSRRVNLQFVFDRQHVIWLFISYLEPSEQFPNSPTLIPEVLSFAWVLLCRMVSTVTRSQCVSWASIKWHQIATFPLSILPIRDPQPSSERKQKHGACQCSSMNIFNELRSFGDLLPYETKTFRNKSWKWSYLSNTVIFQFHFQHDD